MDGGDGGALVGSSVFSGWDTSLTRWRRFGATQAMGPFESGCVAWFSHAAYRKLDARKGAPQAGLTKPP